MDVSEGNAIDDLWTPYKELVAVVEGYLANESGGATYAVHTFESVLRRHKQTFLSLFKNPPKNLASREEIKRGITDGVNLPSIGRTLLSKELVDEAIIISDMYNVNEYLSLELLHLAVLEAARHCALPRGLLAVLLYYDGRRARAHALKELLITITGVCWTINAREEIVNYVSRYVEQLISDGLLGNILDALKRYTLEAELELLQNNRALPPHRHHVKLVACIENTRKLLAGTIFAAAAQRGLERDILLRLISEQSTSPTKDATGALDEVSLALQMALLYALDLSVLHTREDGEELAKKLPLIHDPDLIPVLLDELSPPNGDSQEPEKASGVRALCQLSLGLALAALKRAPKPRVGAKYELLDQDEMLVDAAIDNKVFEYLDEAILSTDFFVKEEYYQRRIHTLITDFIVLMHSKLMEMRVKADEAARCVQMYAHAGVAAPAGVAGGVGGAGGGRSRLHALLRCVEKLYERDPRRLRDHYWGPHDADHSHLMRQGGRSATLYKFVRLSGSLVAGALLPHYLRALASLAVRTHTWALLGARDALSAAHLLTALQRYYCNLRSDPSPFSDHLNSSMGASAIITPAARPGKLLMRQEEVEAMIAALKLIGAVAREDQNAATQICENLQWDAVNTMFGLICCQVPIQLKAELCLALASIGGWWSSSSRVWAALEQNRLVFCGERGLSTDLQMVECRMEEYPLSIAFLTLIESLCSSGAVPRALGAGVRAPGLDPYLSYILTSLALPAPHRPTRKPQEKWQILSLCFRLFARWLDQYEPSAADFPPPGREPETNPPPGFRILLQLHTQSELLRLLLNSLDEALELLDKEPPVGKEYIEQSLISVLQLLDRALALERPFVTCATEVGRSVLIVGLSKLILGAEKAGSMVSWCRCVGTCGAAVGRAALALLARALAQPPARDHLLPQLCRAKPHIRHGFVECLEAEEWGSDEEVTAIRQAKEAIITLLQQVLPSAPPNLAHYLLGFQLNDEISRSTLNEPGVAGAPRTCLHSILDILEQHISAPNYAETEASNLVEGCYRLIYWLTARGQTAPPTLRLLRARDHLLTRHVRHIVNLETASVVSISGRSWLIRALAAACGAAGAGAGPGVGAGPGAGPGRGGVASHRADLAHTVRALTQPTHNQDWDWCVIRLLLEGLPVSVEAVPEPTWELFNTQQLRQAIAACDLPTGIGGKRISVRRVHALLARELASLQATAPQRALVLQEIQKVLDYVTEVNQQRNLAATLTHYYDSWRQLTEILFCVASDDVLSLESRKNLLLNLLQDLLNKIPPAEVLPQLGNLASGTILLLLVNLRHCYILQKREFKLKSTEFETTFFGPSNQIMQTNSLTLKFILHKILSWILVSGGCTQKMRVNLYGALLNYLNIVNLKTSPAEPEEERNTTYVSRLDSSKTKPDREESSLKSMVTDVISGFGDNLCSVVCSDCIGGGHDVCRMVALSCLDTLIDINPRTDWMNTLTNQGYLRSLIDSLLQDDEGLKETLEPNPKSLRVLYVYESKMALLIKIAGTRLGAETILSQGALSCLANMSVLSCHPDIHTGYGSHRDTEFLPTVANRFRQILVPAMALCDALLTTLGTENHSCIIHVTHLLLSHVECLDCVLRSAHPNSPEGLLIELEAITSVIARASNREVFGLVQNDTALQHSAASVQRVQCLMLSLIARFQIPAAPKPINGDAQPTDDSLYYKIVCNLLHYSRNTLSVEGGRSVFPLEGGGCGAILTLMTSLVTRHPHHHPLAITDSKKSEDTSLSTTISQRRANLSVLISMAAESALFVVWAHAHIYLRRAIPKEYQQGLTVSAAWRTAGGTELTELRKGLISVFNDRFAEQLLDIAKYQPPAQRGFIEILLKDIKSMIQFSPL